MPNLSVDPDAPPRRHHRGYICCIPSPLSPSSEPSPSPKSSSSTSSVSPSRPLNPFQPSSLMSYQRQSSSPSSHVSLKGEYSENKLQNSPSIESPVNLSPKRRQRKDYILKETLGKGSYSRVIRAVHTVSGELFAIKIIRRSFLESENKMETMSIEQNALRLLNSNPYVVDFIETFSDSRSFYIVMELASGGTLQDIIDQHEHLTEEAIRFIAAELIHGVCSMHKKGVLHRDIKPANVLLTENGHIRLTDFGSARIIPLNERNKKGYHFQNNDSSDSFTSKESDEEGFNSDDHSKRKYDEHKWTFVGTADYVSPEVLNDKPANTGSDLWAIGCVVYSLLFGYPPFTGATEYIVFQNILSLNYSFPSSTNVSSEILDFICSLLHLDPSERLGYGDPYELRRHPIFYGIDWDKLPETSPPPIITGSSLSSSSTVTQDKCYTHKENDDTYHSDDCDYYGESSDHDELLVDYNEEEEEVSPLDEVTAKFKEELFPEEQVMFEGMVRKKRRLSTKTRQLIITNYPRVFYVDPTTAEVRGQIPISSAVQVNVKSKRFFDVITLRRTYRFECVDHHTAQEWEQELTSINFVKSPGHDTSP